ncbi:MAG: penicillin-binding protein 2 [Cyclobacteriaceae bacterium]|jgi:penicillin-binding protein 2
MNDSRKYIIRVLILVIAIVFSTKLFFIQVLDESYQLAAENNIVQEIIEYPYRGLIFDRNKELLVYNEPSYDLMVVPKELQNLDTVMFCQTFDLDKTEFEELMFKARRYSSIKPSQFIKQITNESFAIVQDRLVDFQGFYPKARTVRKYPYAGLANVFGYIGEVDSRQLRRDTSNYYKSGDYIGKAGIESSYEEALRGKRGVKYKMVNVRGIEKGSFKDGKLDTLAVPGEDITLSIDIELQRYAEKLMNGKIGSVVAIEPSTGEILAFVSSPSYDPNLLTGRNYSKNYGTLQADDSLRPLFNRPLMAMYPPGSIFKVVQGLVALQEGVVAADEQVNSLTSPIGDHAPPGYYNMVKGIEYSSNNYFYKVFRRLITRNVPNDAKSQFRQAPIGLGRWHEMVSQFGVGKPLGTDLPSEKSGLLPGPDYYNRVYKSGSWKFSTIRSLSIGQGELLMNPIQMANLGAIIANRGFYYIPHITKGIGNSGYLDPKYKQKIDVGIDDKHFDPIIDGMEKAPARTAWRVPIRDITICGKTGTAENPHGKDHSVFMAFAPKEAPQIAISVFVENATWGGTAAGPIASLLIEKHIKGKVSDSRKWIEDYIERAEFLK